MGYFVILQTTQVYDLTKYFISEIFMLLFVILEFIRSIFVCLPSYLSSINGRNKISNCFFLLFFNYFQLINLPYSKILQIFKKNQKDIREMRLFMTKL